LCRDIYNKKIMNKYDKKVLNELINEQGLSYEKIGRQYGVSGAAIKKAALRLGLTLPRRRKVNPKETFNKGITRNDIKKCAECTNEYISYSGKKSNCCSTECYNKQKHKIKYQKIIDGDVSIMRANYSLKPYKKDILFEQDNCCEICKTDPLHNGKYLVFIIDHIDGDASNNKRDNLRMICPNCDSQLPTYKSKNKNSSRHHYRYKK